MDKPTDSPHWKALEQEAARLTTEDTSALFTQEPHRMSRFSCEGAGLYLDISKNHLSQRGLEGLLALARDRGLEEATRAMFRGAPINVTEGRAVLHSALRASKDRELWVNGVDVIAQASAERERLLDFVEQVHKGERLGFRGATLTTVVNIGIGGSDLGPLMVVEALRSYGLPGRRSFFVSNIDGQHLSAVLEQIDPTSTLFVIASKTFTTQETMTNAHSAVDWFLAQGFPREAIADHFVALSTNAAAVAEFGISEQRTFGFWDWVGGRYSLWSSIGLSIALQVGREGFLALLRGARAMDEHFCSAPAEENLPVLLALVGIWNRNFEGIGVHAVLPYDQHLHRLPAYLQQADMESNGKAVRIDGSPCEYATGPVLFGEPGTNGQHAFYQLLHQGTDRVSTDFIVAASVPQERTEHHRKLLANLLAQPRALMLGKSEDEVRSELADTDLSPEAIDTLAPHKVFPGNRPSTVILIDRLSPERLGALIALYEHKIFCQGVIWGINSFDQWGVELGKQLAGEILPLIDDATATEHSLGVSLDPSTAALLARINDLRRQA